jgi:hypothetical protein
VVNAGAGRRADGVGPPLWRRSRADAAHPGTFHWYNAPAAFRGLLDSIYPSAWPRSEWVWVVSLRAGSCGLSYPHGRQDPAALAPSAPTGCANRVAAP